MDLDVTQAASAIVPFVTAAVSAYGAQTLDKIRNTAFDEASNQTVQWGHKMLARLLGRAEHQPAIEEAVLDLQSDSNSEDAAAALRLKIRKALSEDPKLLADVSAMLNVALLNPGSVSAKDFHINQHAESFGNSKQAIVGSGVQNVTFDKHEHP